MTGGHLPLGWVDLAFLIVLGVSVLVGLWRGLVFELVSLLGWLVAFVLANTFGAMLGDALPVSPSFVALRTWIGWALVFVLVLIACGLLARLLRALIAATPLSFVDRLLGGLFGAVRGVLVLVVVGMLVLLSPFARSPDWEHSQSALWAGQVLRSLKPVLPQSLNVHFDA